MDAAAYISAFHQLLKQKFLTLQMIYDFFNNPHNNFPELYQAISQDLDLKKYAYLPEMKPIWDGILDDHHGTTLMYTPDENSFDEQIPTLRTQPGIHSLDIILGFYHFCKENHSEAEKYRSYHALERALQLDIEKMRNCEQITATERKRKRIEIDPKAILERAKLLADLHGTPGYFCLAQTYIDLANYYLNIENDRRTHDEFYYFGLQALYTAKELAPFCANAIHNAHYGDGLSDLDADIAQYIERFQINKYTQARAKKTASELANIFRLNSTFNDALVVMTESHRTNKRSRIGTPVA